jgi:hypothetical protein
MICEYCGKRLMPGDSMHGIRYGKLGNDRRFKPAFDTSDTTLCASCGEKIYRIVYGNLDNENLTYPVIFKLLEELGTLMKNGYKFAQGIANLPRAEQVTLKRLVSICKIPR